MDSRRSTPTTPSSSSQLPNAEDPGQPIVWEMEWEAVKNKPLGAYAHLRDPRDKTDVAQRLARTNTSVSDFTFRQPFVRPAMAHLLNMGAIPQQIGRFYLRASHTALRRRPLPDRPAKWLNSSSGGTPQNEP